MTGKSEYEIAVYYFPNYHIDERNKMTHGEGWTEWEIVKHAHPRFPGHQQPKIPLWGYEDESDPLVMEKKISAASSHGISSFIFDWYWYEDGPFLQRALEEGFLKAENNDQLKFALMWANHDWVDIHPAPRNRHYHELYNGAVSESAFIEATNHMIENYFNHPSYWRVKEGLYFSIYELMNLIKGLGGVTDTKRVLKDFRARVRKAGLGDLHLNAVVWGAEIIPNEQKVENVNELLGQLGFDSITSYVWIHHNELDEFPATSYARFRECATENYLEFTHKYDLPYFPNVTMGWDSSPRTIQSDVYQNLGYPYMPILSGNTPEEFTISLKEVKGFLDKGLTNPKIFTINAWNEWTEGSYLEPDTVHGMGYLEAIREVFGEG
ncbi:MULTISPECIES: glycoside hydrolase family 99-like domain-containing protein [unclassified Bacillus (in: firmicutes)]|uniref:glycosyltransferase WbsX family protein n=1 Tax=unclassified Bacillus (in: firmicutes) TaxID=185979 RepID=UPI001596507E|nr:MULTISPECIES: glycoside hydrolase family 99-like domain-containing protein [unclassified Bacillus (in: firmicutes)]